MRAFFLHNSSEVKCTIVYMLAVLCALSHPTDATAGERADFRVNDDNTSAQQNHPRVAVAGDGSFVITWVDFRGTSSDVYLQRFDTAGFPIGSNARVNDDVNNAYQFEPAIGVDLSGLYSIVWKDYRQSYYPFDPDIFFQRYDSSLSPIASNVNITTEPPDSSRETPDIALYQWGGGVVVWADYRNNDWDIYAQVISANGTLIGQNIRVNDDEGRYQQHAPRVAASPEGWFAVAWYDNRNGDDDIYVQRFDSLGIPLGENILVSADTLGLRQAFPDLACDGAGHFTVVWVDWRNGFYPADPDIYARKYDTSMTPVTPENRVNTDNLKTAQREPTIAADRMGNVAIIWADSTASSWDINGQMIDVDGVVREENFRANFFGDSLQLHPDVALDGCFRYVTWADRRNGNFDVYASITRYNDPTLVATPASLKFTMEQGGSAPPPQTVVVEHTGYNRLGFRVDIAGDFIAVSPAVGHTPDTIGVSITTDTLAFGTYLGWLTCVDTVNHDSSARVSVRLDVTAPVMVVVPDTIYCRAFAGIDEDYYEPIALTNAGTGQYSWTASEQSDWLGLNSYSGVSPDSIEAAVNAAGLSAGYYVEPVVLESDAASGSPDTVWVALEVVDNLPYLQVEPDSIFIRADIEAVIDTPVLVSNPGVGILAWQASTEDAWLVLDRTSGFAGDTVNIAIDFTGLATGAHLACIDFVDSGSFNVAKRLPVVLDLYEQSTDTVIFEPVNTRILEPGVMPVRLHLKRAAGRVYLPFRFDASLMSGDSVVFGPSLPDFMECTSVLDGETGRVSLVVEQKHPDSFMTADSYLLADFYFTAGESTVTVLVDTLLLDTLSAHVVASDGRKLSPAIIPGEIAIGSGTAVDELSDSGLPSRFGLSQNYPNPFNLATVIEYGLPRKSRIELEILNILGQRVKSLKAGPSSAGYHRVIWDGRFDNGRTAPSGIYFYRLRSDDVSLVNKMVLVK